MPYRASNPPVQQEPTWDSARTRRLAVAACFDCHSNETATERKELAAGLRATLQGWSCGRGG